VTVESFLGPIGTVLLFLIAGAGAWAGSYLREKGKHYATREDFQKVLEQVAATTRAAEGIKAEISHA
jgi:hypothetical protein